MSHAIATGFLTSGSAAKTLTRKPSGTRQPAAASAGDSGRVEERSVSGGAGKSSPAAGTVKMEFATKMRQKYVRRSIAFRQASG